MIISVVVAGVCVALSRWTADSATTREVARWFIPGTLGEERGRIEPPGERLITEAAKRPSPAPALRPAGFLTRAFSGLRGADGGTWGARNGLTSSQAFSHHLAAVFPPSLYEQHPEFFPLLAGHRLEPPKGSGFWNPDIAREDVARYAGEVASQYFTRHPDDVSFALGVNDALIWGESPELVALAGMGGRPEARNAGGPEGRKSGGPADQQTGPPLKWFRERPDYSKVVFTFMNRAAAELSRTHPDKYLGCLAYYWCENVPDFPVHPRVIPFLTADRSQGYDPDFWHEEMQLQERWARAGQPDDQRVRGADGQRPGALAEPMTNSASGRPADRPDIRSSDHQPGRRLGMYDYIYGGGFLIPRIHTRLIADSLRHARRAGFTDYYAEVNPNWGLDGPMPWLTAQLLRDPEQSREALLDEYYRRYFQESAEPMRRFFEKCEATWMAQPRPAYWLKHYRNESQAVVFPPRARGELRMLLMEAGVLAASRKVQQRVELVSDAFGVTERFCTLYDARQQLIRRVLELPASGAIVSREAKGRNAVGSLPSDQQIAGFLSEFLNARREFIEYTLQLNRAQPLALHPFLWDDYLKNDPVPLAVAALGELARPEPGGRNREQTTALAAGGSWPVTPPVMLQRESLVTPLWSALIERGPSQELLADPGMAGPLRPGRTIAGLPYGVALPEPWQGKVEPSEFHRAELCAPGLAAAGEAQDRRARILRISGTKDTMVSQWVPIPARVSLSSSVNGTPFHIGGIALRGRVSPSTAVSVILAWLDAQQRHVGFKSVRLPDGEWPEFVTLRQAGAVPTGAVWVGLGLRVQNQSGDDWIEATNFSLKQ